MKRSLILILFLMLSIYGCSKKDETALIRKAVSIESADGCHVCGMLISNFDGPKGEAFRKKSSQPLKFCSTRDLLSYYFDPENKRNVTQLWVHDMSMMPWDKIDDKYFIDAKKAWYVVNSDAMGAMGKTLATFSEKTDAETFIELRGGELKNFSTLSMKDLL